MIAASTMRDYIGKPEFCKEYYREYYE
jgi:hypothetical protein